MRKGLEQSSHLLGGHPDTGVGDSKVQADLVAIHSGGGGYAGYMTSAGVTLVADGTEAAAERLKLTLDNDTGLGVLRYADAGYEEATQAAEKHQLGL